MTKHIGLSSINIYSSKSE